MSVSVLRSKNVSELQIAKVALCAYLLYYLAKVKHLGNFLTRDLNRNVGFLYKIGELIYQVNSLKVNSRFNKDNVLQ